LLVLFPLSDNGARHLKQEYKKIMSQTMTQTALNLATAPSHVVLEAAGKTVLRPGGRAATEQLFEWANFKPGETFWNSLLG
jgi:hypothetical protein